MSINGIIVLIGLFLVLIIGIIGLVLIMTTDDRKAIKKKEEKKELEELKERVKVLENQIQILQTEYKKLSGFNSLNQKYR